MKNYSKIMKDLGIISPLVLFVNWQ